MDLVEIDYTEGEAPEAVFHFALDRISVQNLSYISLRVPAQAALGEDVGPRAGPALERAGDDFL